MRSERGCIFLAAADKKMADLVLATLTEDALPGIRRTQEWPRRSSAIDVIAVITGLSKSNAALYLRRMKEQHPELNTLLSQFQFRGRGQTPTDVADVRGIVTIVMVLPGKAAASVRRASADILVRYLGGDPKLVDDPPYCGTQSALV